MINESISINENNYNIINLFETNVILHTPKNTIGEIFVSQKYNLALYVDRRQFYIFEKYASITITRPRNAKVEEPNLSIKSIYDLRFV